MHEDSGPPQAYTYAIGDLHGEVTLLNRMLATLSLRPADTLICLGDYVDRGEDSLATIAALQQLATHHHCIFLRGNHDAAWLEVWDGTRFTERPPIPGSRQVWDACGGQPPAEMGRWLATTRLDYEDGYAFYAHAGALPGVPFWETPTEVKLWGNSQFLTSSYNWGKPIVFGHWPMAMPLVQSNKIGIDTEAYQSGVLTAVRFPGRSIIQVCRL